MTVDETFIWPLSQEPYISLHLAHRAVVLVMFILNN